ncbi:MAG: hypothetical protein ACJAS1_007008 [Oleiphilaceae bacterium]|jgi:hypothetical protein
MQIQDWLMIGAVLVGPIIAVQLTRFIDNGKEKRDRKLNIFKTLMATRAYSISPQHVEALNRIDLEFSNVHKKEREVVYAWKEYLDLLANKEMPREQWATKRIDLLVDLLHKMASVLSYEFDKTHIKNSAYAPVAHGDIEEQQNAIRIGIIDILDGKRALPMYVTNLPPQSLPENKSETPIESAVQR